MSDDDTPINGLSLEELRAACQHAELETAISNIVRAVDPVMAHRWARRIRDMANDGNRSEQFVDVPSETTTYQVLAAAVLDSVVWRALANVRQTIELMARPVATLSVRDDDGGGT